MAGERADVGSGIDSSGVGTSDVRREYLPLRVGTSDVRRKYGSWTKPLRGSFFEIPSTLFFDHQIIE